MLLNTTRDFKTPIIGEVIFKGREEAGQDAIFLDINTLEIFKRDGSQVFLSEEDKKKKYCWRFILDKTGSPGEQSVDVDGEIPGIGSLGNLFDNKLQPKISLTQLEQSTNLAYDWFLEMGFNSKWEKPTALEILRTAATWNYSTGVYKSEARALQGVYLYFIFAILDDSIDNPKTFEESWGHVKSPEKWDETCQCFCSILDGTLALEDIEERANAPLFKSTCKAFAYCRKIAIEISGVDEASIFLDHLREGILSTGLESMLNEGDGRILSEVGYDLVRIKSSGYECCIDFLCLMNNLKISAGIRNSYIFKLLNHLFAIQEVLINDLISWVKESKEDSPSNIVLIKMKHMGISNAYKATLDKYRGAAKDFEIVKKRAYKLFPNDKEFHEYIDILENHTTGVLRFYVDKQRYGVQKVQLIIDG